MRKPIGLLLCMMVFQVSLLLGQTERFTVTYTNASSGIVYQSTKGESSIRVFPGKELPDYGKLSIKRGKWLNIIFNGQKRKLEGPLKVDLAELALEMKVEKKSTFLGRFWNFLGNSVSQTNTASDIEKYHRRYLTNARAGISGFGDKTYPIQLPIYLTETLGNPTFDLNWTTINGVDGYWVTIQDRDDEKLVLKAYTKMNQLTLHLDELNILEGKVYEIQINGQVGRKTPSLLIVFSLATNQVVEEFIAELKQESEWNTLHGMEKDLYLAKQLEEEGFYQSAHHYYQNMINQQPNITFFKQLYAAFLVRMNAPAEAKALLNY